MLSISQALKRIKTTLHDTLPQTTLRHILGQENRCVPFSRVGLF